MKTKIIQLSITFVLVFLLSSCFLSDPETPVEDDTLNIYFDTLGGDVLQPMEISKTDVSITLPTPEKDGYTFVGWSLTEGDDSLFNLNFSTFTSTSVTLYAVWEANEYTITVHPENGEDNYTLTYATGDDIIAIPQPTYTDHIFIDWYLDETYETPLELSTMPAYDFDLYVRWAQDISYTEDNVIWTNIASMDATTLTIDIVIDGAVRFVGYEMEVSFDTTGLSLSSYTNGLENIVNDTETGLIKFNYVDAVHPIEETTVIITIEFDVVNANNVDVSIAVDNFIDVTNDYSIIDADFEIIPFATE